MDSNNNYESDTFEDPPTPSSQLSEVPFIQVTQQKSIVKPTSVKKQGLAQPRLLLNTKSSKQIRLL